MDEAEWANTIGHDPMTGEKDGLYTIEGTIDAVSDPAPPASGAEQSDKDAHWVHFTNSYEPVQPEPDPEPDPEEPGQARRR